MIFTSITLKIFFLKQHSSTMSLRMAWDNVYPALLHRAADQLCFVLVQQYPVLRSVAGIVFRCGNRTLKCPFSDVCDIGRNGDRRHVLYPNKSTVPDSRHAVGEGHRGQSCAPSESIFSDMCQVFPQVYKGQPVTTVNYPLSKANGLPASSSS